MPPLAYLPPGLPATLQSPQSLRLLLAICQLDRAGNFHYKNWAEYLGYTYRDTASQDSEGIVDVVAHFVGCSGSYRTYVRDIGADSSHAKFA